MSAAIAPASAPEDDPLAVRLLYSPHRPTPPQQAFLLLDDLAVREALYGGAAGGGKSDALLMAALRYVDVPGYAALLLRRTYADLALPGALMDRAQTWLAGTDARWNATDSRWTFPSGATLSFGYLQTAKDRYRYASAEFQFIGFDEVTQFDAEEYRFLFTRLRRPSDGPLAGVPLRMRSASNPGGRGHNWVLSRLIERVPAATLDPDDPAYDPQDTRERAERRIFVPARLDDNPHVDRAGYEESLANVDPYLRAQMLAGDWYARQPGAWVYDHDGLTAAEALGDEYDALLAAGQLPPPAGDLLAVGIDWGEHSHAVILWPLPGGGIYVEDAQEYVGNEPGATALGVLGMVDDAVQRGRACQPAAFAGDRAAASYVEAHRYDAAGIQSMRTYLAEVRRHHPRARSVAVAFGAPSPESGKRTPRQSYKAEGIGYLRRLVRATAARAHPAGTEAYVRDTVARPANTTDEAWDRLVAADTALLARTGSLALSKRAADLRRQLRALEWSERDLGKVRKGDDHGPDALVAGVAPVAIRHR